MKTLNHVALLLFVVCCFLNCKQNVTSNTVLNTDRPQKKSIVIPQVSSTSTSSNFDFTNESFGCESFTVYKFNKDKTIALWINGENSELKLSKTPQTFEFGKGDKIYAALYKFDANVGKYFCDDIADDNPNVINRWAAIQGKVIAYITEETKANQTTYRMTLKVESVVLKDKKEETVELKNVLFENVSVGKFSG